MKLNFALINWKNANKNSEDIRLILGLEIFEFGIEKIEEEKRVLNRFINLPLAGLSNYVKNKAKR